MDEDYTPEPPKSLADLMKGRELPKKQKHRTERGDLLTYFHQRIKNKQGKEYRMAFIASKLAHLELQDLYFLKSTCEDAQRRGKPFGAIFWWSIKVK